MVDNEERLLHREIVAAVMGRELDSDEHVHHKNENKTDNRPEKLELLLVREHNRLHMTPAVAKTMSKLGHAAR